MANDEAATKITIWAKQKHIERERERQSGGEVNNIMAISKLF